MKIIQKVLIIVLFLTASCTSTRVLTPAEIKLMTTKQYEEPYDIVFKSVMSLLQSKQFVIEETDYNTGLIIATKNIYRKKTATLVKGSILIDKVNDELSEVKLTIYAGEQKTKNGLYGSKNTIKTENMVEDPVYYKEWFTNLYVEIERRKALM